MQRTNRTIRDAFAREKLKAALLIKAGEFLSADKVAELLGITSEEVKEGRFLVAIPLKNGDRAWPSFQFESHRMFDGVERVLAVLDIEDPWAKLNFFFLHLQELSGKTTVQAIREGRVESAVLAASHFGNRGAS